MLGASARKTGEDFAKKEYDRFAQRRREYKETIGQEESIKQLEAAAKQLRRKLKKSEDGE